jgi:hypothetical protein
MADAAKPAAEEKKPEEGEKKPEEGAEGEKKDGEKKEGAEGEKKKCVGKAECPKPPVNFSGPKQGLDGMKKKLDDKVKNAGKNIMTAITNPAKCASIAVGAVPSMIDGVFKSISSGLDGVAKSFGGVTTAAANQGFGGIMAPFKIGHAMFTQKLQNLASDIALGPDFWIKHPEFKGMDIKKIAPIITNAALKRSQIYSAAIDDAEFRAIFKPWLKQYTDSLMKVLKIAQPDIDRINADVKGIIEGMGDNVGDSIGRAISGVITSALGALPVVGGIASAINAADQLGTKFIEKCGPIVAKGAGIYVPVKMGIDKQINRLNCEADKLSHKLDPLMKKLENATTVGPKKGQSGGMQSGCGSGRNIKKKIQKTTKRINYLLKRFTCRRTHKTNYTRRLNTRQC